MRWALDIIESVKKEVNLVNYLIDEQVQMDRALMFGIKTDLPIFQRYSFDKAVCFFLVDQKISFAEARLILGDLPKDIFRISSRWENQLRFL